jgi:hypothetical protein
MELLQDRAQVKLRLVPYAGGPAPPAQRDRLRLRLSISHENFALALAIRQAPTLGEMVALTEQRAPVPVESASMAIASDGLCTKTVWSIDSGAVAYEGDVADRQQETLPPERGHTPPCRQDGSSDEIPPTQLLRYSWKRMKPAAAEARHTE